MCLCVGVDSYLEIKKNCLLLVQHIGKKHKSWPAMDLYVNYCEMDLHIYYIINVQKMY